MCRQRPRQDSNLRTWLRRPLLYPLSYEGGPSRVQRLGSDRCERAGHRRRRLHRVEPRRCAPGPRRLGARPRRPLLRHEGERRPGGRARGRERGRREAGPRGRRGLRGACSTIAAHRAVPRSVEHPLGTDLANMHGTLTVLVAAMDVGVRRVVSASSSSVYGGAEVLPTPESAPLVPRSPYAVIEARGRAVRPGLHRAVRARDGRRCATSTCTDRASARLGLRRGDPAVHRRARRRARDPSCTATAPRPATSPSSPTSVAANLAASEAPAERCAGRAYNIAAGRAALAAGSARRCSGRILGVEPDPSSRPTACRRRAPGAGRSRRGRARSRLPLPRRPRGRVAPHRGVVRLTARAAETAQPRAEGRRYDATPGGATGRPLRRPS